MIVVSNGKLYGRNEAMQRFIDSGREEAVAAEQQLMTMLVLEDMISKEGICLIPKHLGISRNSTQEQERKSNRSIHSHANGGR